MLTNTTRRRGQQVLQILSTLRRIEFVTDDSFPIFRIARSHLIVEPRT